MADGVRQQFVTRAEAIECRAHLLPNLGGAYLDLKPGQQVEPGRIARSVTKSEDSQLGIRLPWICGHLRR